VQNYLNLPRAIDYNQIKQYKVMKKFLPNVPENKYTYQAPGIENLRSTSTPNFIKIAHAHEDFLWDNCNADKLRTFRLNIPKHTCSFDN